MRSLSICLLAAACVGSAGPEGMKGMNGADGLPGINGTNGRDGVDGLPGAPGTNGRDGVDGLPGANGTPGTNGTNGMLGMAGMNGVNGVDGTSVSGSSEPPGANCATGGSRFVSATGTTYACNGANGSNGTSVSSRPVPPGSNCPNGGTSYSSASGVDFVCNGAAGPPGPPGVVYNFTRVVPHTGNALTSGQSLRDTLAALSPPPGAGVRWKIQLDPGQYDLGPNGLTLISVALVGAGRRMTEITGAPTGPLIVIDTSSELSDLAVDRTSLIADAVVSVRSDSSAHDLWIRKTVASAVVSNMLQIVGSRSSVRDIRVEGTSSQTATIIGILIQAGPTQTQIRDVEVSLTAPNAINVYGISISPGTVALSGARVELTLGPGVTNAVAVEVGGPSYFDGDNIRALVSGSGAAGATFHGLFIGNSDVTLRGSHFSNGSGGATTTAVGMSASAVFRAMTSKFEGFGNGINAPGTSGFVTVRMQHSILDGVKIGTVGSYQCTLVTTTAGASRAADCN